MQRRRRNVRAEMRAVFECGVAARVKDGAGDRAGAVFTGRVECRRERDGSKHDRFARGHPLRVEVYAEDGTAAAAAPYTVTASIQRASGDRAVSINFTSSPM